MRALLFIALAAAIATAEPTPVFGPQPPPPTPPAPVTVATVDEIEMPDSVTKQVEPKKEKWIEPYGAIAGGMHLQSFHQPPDVKTAEQNPTVAVSRLGLRG